MWGGGGKKRRLNFVKKKGSRYVIYLSSREYNGYSIARVAIE
jgi:hypothetical protein